MTLDGSYLDRTELKSKSIAPASMIDGERFDPTGAWTDPERVQNRADWFAFVDSTLQDESDTLNARLRKRYSAPFSSPYPRVIQKWLGRIVTPILFLKYGILPSDEQYAEAARLAAEADAQVQQAADSETGLFDLPLRADKQESAITQGGPFAYSEASPYQWLDAQREALQ